jgi:hypothetical protein
LSFCELFCHVTSKAETKSGLDMKKKIAVILMVSALVVPPASAGYDSWPVLAKTVKDLVANVGQNFLDNAMKWFSEMMENMTTSDSTINDMPEGVKKAWCPDSLPPEGLMPEGTDFGCIEYKKSDTVNDVVIKGAATEINADIAKQANAKTTAVSTATHVKIADLGAKAANTSNQLSVQSAAEAFDARKSMTYLSGMANAVNTHAGVTPGDQSPEAAKKLIETLTVPLIAPAGTSGGKSAGSAADPTGLKNQMITNLLIGSQGVLNLPSNARNNGMGPAQQRMFQSAARRMYANGVFLAQDTVDMQAYRNSLMSEYVAKPTDKDLSYADSQATDATVLRYHIIAQQGTNKILIDILTAGAEEQRALAISNAALSDLQTSLMAGKNK